MAVVRSICVKKAVATAVQQGVKSLRFGSLSGSCGGSSSGGNEPCDINDEMGRRPPPEKEMQETQEDLDSRRKSIL